MKKCTGILSLFLGVILFSPEVFASTGGTGALPYEGWIETLSNSVTGPFAFGAALIGVVASGATLLFGGDLNGFFRTMLFLVLVISLVIAAKNLMSSFFGKSALILLGA